MKAPRYFIPFVGSCLILWVGLFLCKLFLLQNPDIIIKFMAKLIYLPHFFILLSTFKIYKNADLENRNILLWFAITNIGLLLNDVSWYFVSYFHFNLIHVALIPFLLNLIPFFIWVVAIIVFSAKILNLYILQTKRQIKMLSMLVLINLAIILLFLSTIHYAAQIFSLLTVSQISTFIAQVIVFDFVILCLIHTENRGLAVFLSGIIILISGDFFIIYSVISQVAIPYLYGELLWLLGLLFNLFGTLMIKYEANYNVKSWVRKDNTIKSKLIFWCFSTAIISFLFFFIIAYSFSIINRIDLLGLPLFIMIYSLIVIILFSYVGKYFEEPFKQIAANIGMLMLEDKKSKPDIDFSIAEFVFLQQFITDAFKSKEEKEKERLKLELERVQTQVALKEEQLKNEAFHATAQEQEKIKKNVRQMMHDITSPILSIDTIVSRLSSNVPENDRVTLRNASERIASISQKLLNQYEKNDVIEDSDEILLIALALLQIMNEKREEHRDTGIIFEVNIDKSVYFTFIQINSGIFKRMISNLVNNAVEALKSISHGKVTLQLFANSNKTLLIVKDNGPGMTQHIQDKFKEGIEVTEGKEYGHGIGLTQVRDAIKAGDGTCSIQANENGTTFTIWFPKVDIPNWIATEIKLTKDDTVIILDDDNSIHGAWDSNFKHIIEQVPTLKIKHFSQGKEVIAYINNLTAEQKQNTFLLSDYELLNQGINGLDVVMQTKILRAILVTSYSSNKNIQTEVTKARIKMLPKELASAAQIIVDQKIVKWSKVVDMVWVEDQDWFVNDLVKRYYSHLKVDLYYDPISFMEAIQQYPLDTRIILDTYYESPDKIPYAIDGFSLARELHAMGYKKLILYAGEAPIDFVPEYLTVVLKSDYAATENLDKI